jgi:hypothetical protein
MDVRVWGALFAGIVVGLLVSRAIDVWGWSRMHRAYANVRSYDQLCSVQAILCTFLARRGLPDEMIRRIVPSLHWLGKNLGEPPPEMWKPRSDSDPAKSGMFKPPPPSP